MDRETRRTVFIVPILAWAGVIAGVVFNYGYARIPGLNLASTRSTNGSVGMTYSNFGPQGVPGFGSQLPDNVAPSAVFLPDVFVFDKNFQNPRTLNVTGDPAATV